MKFYAHERLKHPQAKRIPEYLFSCEFHFELTDEQIKLMTTPLKEILENPSNFITDQSNINAAWICILVNNPDASIKQLWKLAQFLECEPRDIFYIASTLGQLGIVKKMVGLYEPEEIEEMLTYCDARAFKFAAEEGHREVIEYLNDELTEEHLIESRINWFHYSCICAKGHLNVIKFFEREIPGFAYTQLKVNFGACLIRAVEHGHLSIVRFLVSFITLDDLDNEFSPRRVLEAAYTEAVLNGHLSIVLLLEQKMKIYSDFAAKVMKRLINHKPLTLKQMEVLDHLTHFDGCRIVDITDITVIDEPQKLDEVLSKPMNYSGFVGLNTNAPQFADHVMHPDLIHKMFAKSRRYQAHYVYPLLPADGFEKPVVFSGSAQADGSLVLKVEIVSNKRPRTWSGLFTSYILPAEYIMKDELKFVANDNFGQGSFLITSIASVRPNGEEASFAKLLLSVENRPGLFLKLVDAYGEFYPDRFLFFPAQTQTQGFLHKSVQYGEAFILVKEGVKLDQACIKDIENNFKLLVNNLYKEQGDLYNLTSHHTIHDDLHTYYFSMD